MSERESLKIATLAAQAADDKKAEDVVVLDMRDLTAEFDYLTICSVPTSTQLRAVIDEILERLEEEGISPARQEGRNRDSWVLLDYRSVIVHVFLTEERTYYSLEKLWADAKQVAWQ
ncbi:MAG: ribosome silencing factor [Firmicutes bacterium]|nr:ribosome silencing factor [Bacillota bacterium]